MNTNHRPKLSFYHPNAKGTGAMIEFERHPSTEQTDGYILLTMAKQISSNTAPAYQLFDITHPVSVKLGFTDICKMLQVFRGECETIDAGKGLYHRSAQGARIVRLSHRLEPYPCYLLEVIRTEDGDERSGSIAITPAEALGISYVMGDSLGVICFGYPNIVNN